MALFKKGFTLTELLVVIILIGLLSAASVPKLSRVLESRRTMEAEQMLSAVRNEQEMRCLTGKSYAGVGEDAQIAALANANESTNYTYRLINGGIEAYRGSPSTPAYTLRMWYKTGELCCKNGSANCVDLNKAYPICSGNTPPQSGTDECL